MNKNELIADFIGLAKQYADPDKQWPMYENPETGEYCFPEYLEYDYSWDWLMSVVLEIVPPKGFPLCLTKYQSKVVNCLQRANFEATHAAVLEFIEEYNKTTKHESH
jgi:hypothetical protein